MYKEQSFDQIVFFQEEFDNTKGVIRIRKSKKNGQYNGQRKKYKSTKGQTTIYKTLDSYLQNSML
jgi:hypothetical protein